MRTPNIESRFARRIFNILPLAALFIAGCGGGGSAPVDRPADPPPAPIDYVYAAPVERGDGWTVANAGVAGVDVQVLETMMDDIAAGQFSYIDSVAIARAGQLVFDETIRATVDAEDARVGNLDPAMHRLYSASKSITSLLVGIAIDDGHIDSTAVAFLDLFDYGDYANWDPRKTDITLGDVLAMQAGLQWNEFDPPYTSPENQLNKFIERETDYAKAFLDLPLAAAPGTAFAYNTVASVALGQAIENSAPMSIIDYGLDGLFLPLGITDIEVLTTPTGLPNGGSGFYLKTRDALKFGQLLLSRGSWNGERIVSEAWLEESLEPRTAVSWSNPEDWDWQLSGYAYQWWTGYYEYEGQEFEAWVAWGFGGQWIIAIPELELAVAINANGYDGADEALNQGHALVRRYILPASIS